MKLEPGGIVTMVEVVSEDWPLRFSECLGKAKVTESGAGRVNSGRWEVLVRGICVVCSSACRESSRVVVEDEIIVFSLREDFELERSHGLNGTLCS